MDRSIIYSQEQGRSFDIQAGWKDSLIAFGRLARSIFGGVPTIVSGLSAAAQATPDMTIILAAGEVFQFTNFDTTPWGAMPSDSTQVFQQGHVSQQTLEFHTDALSAGQSQYALVQATFAQVDEVRENDPTGGVLPYYNSSNPPVPLQGPADSGEIQPTVRRAKCNISIVYGTPATTGSEVPPRPSGGCVGLYLIDLTFGQVTITTGQISKAGPSVSSLDPTYPPAPFIAGLLNAHHHGASPGEAPQIDLTSEVQNRLPMANLRTSNDDATGGVVNTRIVGGNPNNVLAGNSSRFGCPDMAWDSVNQILYVCVTTGIATGTGHAVWVAANTAGGGGGGGGGSGLSTISGNFVVFTNSGTYSPSAGTQFISFELFGGGGGGGGGCSGLDTHAAVGGAAGGGGAGAAVVGTIDKNAIASGFTVTIGAAGAGGTGGGSTGTAGQIGGNSQITNVNFTATAQGGGGAPANSQSGITKLAAGYGGNGGSASFSGSINAVALTGGAGGSGSFAAGGSGANTARGGGGHGASQETSNATVGSPGGAGGGGGGGSYVPNNGTAGAAGGKGLLLIWEHKAA